MVRNRKARLLLRVPALCVGAVSYYNVTNSRILFVVGSVSGINVRNRTRAEKRRAAAYRREMRSIGFINLPDGVRFKAGATLDIR